MIRDVCGIIYTGENDTRLRELTQQRSVAALPIWGRYRGIDLLLSSMVNSGILNIGVITQRNYHSLMDHIASGKEWDLNRKRDGLFILPPFTSTDSTAVSTYHGMVDALHNIYPYIKRCSQKYVLLSTSHTFYNADYNALFEYHLERDADITMMYNTVPPERMTELTDNVHLQMDGNGQVWDLEVRPQNPKSNNVFMEAAVMERTLLEYLVQESYNRGKYDMNLDVMLPAIHNYKVFGFRYDRFVARIESVQAYFRNNMAILSESVRDQIFSTDLPIYTKAKDEAPSYYGSHAHTENMLAGSGCIIEGSVGNSVLFRGVRVGQNAQLKNCVAMQGSEIQENVQLENVILDKQVLIRRGVRLIGTPDYPLVVPKGMVI